MIRKSRTPIGIVVAAGLLCIAGFARADQIDEKRRELEKIEREIEREREKLGSDIERESSLLKELEAIEKICMAAEEEIVRTRIERNQLKNLIKEKEDEIQGVESQLDHQREVLGRLLVSAYKLGPLGGLKFVWASESLKEVDRGFFLVRRLAKEGKETIGRFQELERESRKQRSELEHELEKIAAIERKMVKEKIRMERSRKEKIDLVEHIRNNKELRRQMIVDLEKAARSLEEMLASFVPRTDRLKGGESYGFKEQKGILPCPAHGVVMRGFGIVEDPEFHTILFRKGIEIEAEGGERVTAVAAGEVIYSGWFEGYGNIIIIDHGEGYYTLSARLKNVTKKVGDSVSRAEEVGQVAGSGLWGGTGLYFEIRHNGQPLDPEEWLVPSGEVGNIPMNDFGE